MRQDVPYQLHALRTAMRPTRQRVLPDRVRACHDAKHDLYAHPTVKPVALMRYLLRLVTPLDGLILDPFAGTATTLEAARLEGIDAIGIEQDAINVRISRVRLT